MAARLYNVRASRFPLLPRLPFHSFPSYPNIYMYILLLAMSESTANSMSRRIATHITLSLAVVSQLILVLYSWSLALMPTNVSRPPYMPQLSSLGSVPFISMHIEYKPIDIYSSNTAAISTKYRKQHHQDGALPYRLFYITRTLCTRCTRRQGNVAHGRRVYGYRFCGWSCACR